MRRIGITCITNTGAIGYNNKLLYRIPAELSMFKKITLSRCVSRKQNIVVMGRKTFESMNSKPLPGRFNCVISSNWEKLSEKIIAPDLKFFPSIPDTIEYYDSHSYKYSTLFVCGGTSVYDYFIKNNLLDYLIVSQINNHEYNVGDSFFPEYTKNFKKLSSFKHYNKPGVVSKCNSPVHLDYTYKTYINKNNYLYTDDILDFTINDIIDMTKPICSEDTDIDMKNDVDSVYLSALTDVLHNGTVRKTRNSKTISKFGVHMEYDISANLPLLTTKRVYWPGVIKELLWFIKGDTNAKNLHNDKVKIWDGNSSREFLDANGLQHYKEGDCGPIYGFQWRNFNAPYIDYDTCYNGKGVDQLQNVIDLITNDPFSRRIIMSAWNPQQMDEMCLPPCHVLYQFYVNIDDAGNKLLSCSMYQRSGDMFLGIPFNIASTATLTYIIAHMTGCKPDKVIVNIGDAHIYENHVDAIHTQLSRSHKHLPVLNIIGKPKTNINDYTIDDFVLENYRPHNNIKADMVA